MKKSNTKTFEHWQLICESMNPEELINNSYSVKEVAALFKTTGRTVYSWINDKKIFSYQPFKIHFIPKEYIAELIKSSTRKR